MQDWFSELLIYPWKEQLEWERTLALFYVTREFNYRPRFTARGLKNSEIYTLPQKSLIDLSFQNKILSWI